MKYWFLAARPKTLFVSASPVILGCVLAYHQGDFHWLPGLICLLFALLAQIASNFINDYDDHAKGADREDRLGPARMVASGHISPQAMKRAALATLGLALLLGLSLLYWGGWELILVGAFVALGVFAYSGGPYPLAYHGLGDVMVVIFYGIIPVYFTYYVQHPVFDLTVLLASLGVGLLGSNLLIVNNYRDYEADQISGKRTSVQIFGKQVMGRVYLANVFLALSIASVFATDQLYVWGVGALLLAIFSLNLYRKLTTLPAKELNQILGKTSINVLFYVIWLSMVLLFN